MQWEGHSIAAKIRAAQAENSSKAASLNGAGCPVVVVNDVGTDWRTVSCLINDHALVCKGGLYGLANPPPKSNAHSAQIALRPPRLAPARWGTHSGNRNKAIADRGQRKQELDNDEYTEDVKPRSVKCRGCQQTLKLEKQSRYHPGLWLKHREKYRGILKMEADKRLTRERDWGFQSNPERHAPAATSFDASGEESDEDEYQPRHIMGFSTSYVRGGREWGRKIDNEGYSSQAFMITPELEDIVDIDVADRLNSDFDSQAGAGLSHFLFLLDEKLPETPLSFAQNLCGTLHS
ncbi:hypothetical protein CY34DRAFT_7553 [Suillus luteus UH-Slu-Lm8-n1]|uniref:Uncharacterized protein n=1 Tax=Suillus luteus UH-Slu-Lm8-n1 TaxID=930992 RepID=A0A0D0B589_9AGAM|nr:hypothetical protein CY34DRAFT_7553 [Suillus luteus UH-Slu-Lm8-n1]